MSGTKIMFIAGETSGDMLAAELVEALRRIPPPHGQPLPIVCIGAGGPRMAAAGVDLSVDLTRHAVVGLTEVFRNYLKFRRLFRQLLDLAARRQPDVVVCVDFSGFNRRFAAALRKHARSRAGWFLNWSPRIVQYVSPQVWASRPGRTKSLARDLDMLLCLFPFEKEWYAQRAPSLRVEFVGHPLVDRHASILAPPGVRNPAASGQTESAPGATAGPPLVVLLPGSRVGELDRHVPLVLDAARLIASRHPARFRMVLPDETHVAHVRRHDLTGAPQFEVGTGGLAEALAEATIALACTGTVTLECAIFGVPTVAFYKTSWSTYQIARRMVTVPYVAMPNLLASDEVYTEFIQNEATPEKVASAACDLLADPRRRESVRDKLRQVTARLGGPGAADRAAAAIASLL